MVEEGFVTKEETIKVKPNRKRTARQANMENIPTMPKRTNRQQSIYEAAQKKI